MKQLYGTVDSAEAEQLRQLLRDRGIDSELEQGGGVFGILVRDEDAAAAAEALADHFEKSEGGGSKEPAPVEKKDRAGCLFWILDLIAEKKDPPP